jgi:hypothetical protein
MHPFVWLGVVLLIAWAVLWLGFQIISGIVHLLALAAVVFIVWGLLKKGVNAVTDRT